MSSCDCNSRTRICRTIGEAWLIVNQACLAEGRTYTIDRGSFEGHQRKQLDFLAFIITHPGTRPLGVEYRGKGISTNDSIQAYFADYLVGSSMAVNEVYTYGSRIAPYLAGVARMLRDTPNTNQAIIEVGRPEDTLLNDPPCLRLLSWKVTPNGLQLTTFWRSWDLYAALPVNVGGIQLLNEMMAEWAELEPGPQVCCSDGAHIYDYCWDLVGLPEGLVNR